VGTQNVIRAKGLSFPPQWESQILHPVGTNLGSQSGENVNTPSEEKDGYSDTEF